MQKVVSIYLKGWKFEHGATDEYLAEYLADGWRVVSISTAGGSGGLDVLNVFVVVLMEK